MKAIGAQDQGPPGSWSKGIPALRAQLGALGLDLEDALAGVNGS